MWRQGQKWLGCVSMWALVWSWKGSNRRTATIGCHAGSTHRIMLFDTAFLDGLLGKRVAGCEENLETLPHGMSAVCAPLIAISLFFLVQISKNTKHTAVVTLWISRGAVLSFA